jgi:hypothetical protein
MDTPSPSYEVVIRWTPGDVQYLCPYMSRDRAEQVLDDIGHNLRDRSIELGWEVLSDLLSFGGHFIDPTYRGD